MPSVSLTGEDTIQINDLVISGLADQSPTVLDFPNELAKVKSSKNGNTIYAFNDTGRSCKLTLRLILGCMDDKELDALRQGMINAFSSFTLLTGNFTKRVGDGQGGTNDVVYVCSGGIFTKTPGAETSADGDTNQSVTIYDIMFGNGTRTIQ